MEMSLACPHLKLKGPRAEAISPLGAAPSYPRLLPICSSTLRFLDQRRRALHVRLRGPRVSTVRPHRVGQEKTVSFQGRSYIWQCPGAWRATLDVGAQSLA